MISDAFITLIETRSSKSTSRKSRNV